MANKITKKDMFKAIAEVEGVASNPAMVDFINHEIELLEKKASSKKATKTQVANEGLKAEILSVLTSEGATVSDIIKKSEALSGLSNQKVSALLKQMVDSGDVTKVTDKKKSFFSLPSED